MTITKQQVSDALYKYFIMYPDSDVDHAYNKGVCDMRDELLIKLKE